MAAATDPYGAVILVGGRATRLGGLAVDIPKCLLPVCGHPFLDLLVRKLHKEGCDGIVLVGGHLVSALEEYVSQHLAEFSIRIICNTDGTAPALLSGIQASEHYENVLCLNGDTILDIDYGAFVRAHRGSGYAASLVVTSLPDAPDLGVIELDSEHTIVSYGSGANCRFDVGQLTRASNCGCYCFNRAQILPILRGFDVKSLEAEVFPALVQIVAVRAHLNGLKYFLDFGTPERYRSIGQLEGVVKRIFYLK